MLVCLCKVSPSLPVRRRTTTRHLRTPVARNFRDVVALSSDLSKVCYFENHDIIYVEFFSVEKKSFMLIGKTITQNKLLQYIFVCT